MQAAPPEVHEAADAALAELPGSRRELFRLRLDRWWTDLADGLTGVYPPADADVLARRLVAAAAAAFADRDPDLARLDEVRSRTPDWFQRQQMMGYAAYADRFAGDLQGVRSRIDYLEDLGVTYLHLMPLLLPRQGDSDGGYAVADYRTVRPDLGTTDDLAGLAAALRASGITLVLDLVLNHVAREHPWAVAARAGDPHYRAYFRIFDDRTQPDAYERTLPEVFPDFAPGSFTFDAEADGWVWTTFNSWQWDLDWSNPDVFAEYAGIILFLAGLGVEVLRLDAIAFLWKRMGTNCQNQPEVHAITQALRALARIACPAVLFKAEAIVGPGELVAYLGEGERAGRVSDLAYHNSLMVQSWSMLAARDVTLAAHALRALPVAPSTTAWITYIRCHDDIGWAIDDEDAAAVGLSGYGHRGFLSDFYTGAFPSSPARGLVFQHNPATGDRRISGTAASLAGLQAALENGDEAGVDAAIERLLLLHALVLGWGGIPVVWMGDELGLLNDPGWAREEGHAGDNRWVHRPRMDWAAARARTDPSTVAGRLFTGLRAMARVRAGLVQLHAAVAPQVLEPSDPGVLPVLRASRSGSLVGLYNVTDAPRPWPRRRLLDVGIGSPVEVRTGTALRGDDAGDLWLPPRAAWWVVDGAGQRVEGSPR